MFGLFGSKDWNVIAVIYERPDLFRVNGNRATGSAAVKARDGAKTHKFTLFWVVFDQKRGYLEGEPGPAAAQVPSDVFARLKREIPTNPTVKSILAILEQGQSANAAKPLIWQGYPKPDVSGDE